MKTEDLELFNLVVDCGSQNEAARSLGVPGSTVSRRMAQLEHSLGVRLFERSTRGLILTDAGMKVLKHGQQVLSSVETLELSVSRLQKRPAGTVTVAAPLDFIRLVCQGAFSRFNETYPELKLRFLSYQSRQNPLDIQADIVLFAGHQTPPDSSMIARKFMTLQRSFVASPDFVRRHPELNHPSQLGEYPCLLSAKGAQPSRIWLWSEDGATHEVEVDGPIESEINDLCVTAAVEGVGIAWVPLAMCRDQISQGRLVPLFEGKYATPIYGWTLYTCRHYLPKRVMIVLDFIQEEMVHSDSVRE